MIQRKEKNRKIWVFGLFVCILLFAIGCGKGKRKPTAQNGETVIKENDESEKKAEAYDEVKNMVFVSRDEEAGSVALQDVESGSRYTLKYTGGTYVYNKSGNPITMEQIEAGELVEASFYYADSRLGKLQIAKDAWVYEDVEDTKINRANFRMNIYDSNYRFGDQLFILSNGKELGINELNEEDALKIRGIGKNVYSITVVRGHGYIVLTGYENFVDGWVEVGSKVITRVLKDMILVAPEGDYVLTVEKNGFGGYKNITVLRDEEIKVDVSDLKEAERQTGNVRFSIEPAGAKLYIAGEERDYSNLIALDYGTYKVRVTADGYEPYEGKVTVDNLVKEQEIKLTKTGEASDGSGNSENNSAATENTGGSTDTGTYKVIVNSPEGAEAYLDGAYVGRVPVTFAKRAGSHTLTFRRDGYTTKSYTIEVDSEKKDLTMAFPNLELKTSASSTKSSTSMEEIAKDMLDTILSK